MFSNVYNFYVEGGTYFCKKYVFVLTPQTGESKFSTAPVFVHIREEAPVSLRTSGLPLKRGGYLLSHFRSTIGASGLNFSVRDGKRWDPAAIAT